MSFVATTSIKEGNQTVKSKEQLSQIIDTTLLKCYLQVSINRGQFDFLSGLKRLLSESMIKTPV